MVDRISGNDTNPLTQHLLSQQTQTVEEVNKDAAKTSSKVVSLAAYNDRAEVSTDAKRMLEAEKFGKLALQLDEPFDADKVSQMRALVQNGKINEILRDFSDEGLADALLKSPVRAFLR